MQKYFLTLLLLNLINFKSACSMEIESQQEVLSNKQSYDEPRKEQVFKLIETIICVREQYIKGNKEIDSTIFDKLVASSSESEFAIFHHLDDLALAETINHFGNITKANAKKAEARRLTNLKNLLSELKKIN